MNSGRIILIVLLIVIIIIIVAEILELRRYNEMQNVNVNSINNFTMKSIIRTVGEDKRLVVTLSTIPDRIELIGPTLASLLTQTLDADEIAINIPWKSRKGLEYEIPDWLTSLTRYRSSTNVKIYRVEVDEGPATKLLPTLRRENNDTMIIAVDDDVIYNSRTVAKLVSRYEQTHQAITSFGIKLQKDGSLPTMKSRVGGFFNGSREVDLVQGFSGFLVTPEMFPKEVYDLSIGPPESISVDDVHFSGWLRYNGTKIITSGRNFTSLPLVNLGKMRATTALGEGENQGFERDQIVIQWFIDEMNVKPVSLSERD